MFAPRVFLPKNRQSGGGFVHFSIFQRRRICTFFSAPSGVGKDAGQKQNLVRNLSSARLDGVFAAVAARVRGEGAARRDGTAAGVIQKLDINLLEAATPVKK